MARNPQRQHPAGEFPASDQRKSSTEAEIREAVVVNQGDIQSVTATELLGSTANVAPAERAKAFVGKYGEKADKLPDRFKYTATPVFPYLKPKGRDGSVWNRIYQIATQHPGITGAELCAKMVEMEWKNPTDYAKNGTVCLAWAAGYVNGGMRERHAVLTTSFDVFKEKNPELAKGVSVKTVVQNIGENLEQPEAA